MLIGSSAPVSAWSVALARPSALSGSIDRLALTQRCIERLPFPRMELHERQVHARCDRITGEDERVREEAA
ncbi:hypothetical protein WME91_16810 [Sorangium sp. So ce269]